MKTQQIKLSPSDLYLVTFERKMPPAVYVIEIQRREQLQFNIFSKSTEKFPNVTIYQLHSTFLFTSILMKKIKYFLIPFSTTRYIFGLRECGKIRVLVEKHFPCLVNLLEICVNSLTFITRM